LSKLLANRNAAQQRIGHLDLIQAELVKYGTENSKFESGHPKSSCVVDSAQFVSFFLKFPFFCYLFVLIIFFIKSSVLLIPYHTFVLKLASYVLLAYCSQNELCQNLSWHKKVTNTRGEGKKKGTQCNLCAPYDKCIFKSSHFFGWISHFNFTPDNYELLQMNNALQFSYLNLNCFCNVVNKTFAIWRNGFCHLKVQGSVVSLF
jgi:hypothetical protein